MRALRHVPLTACLLVVTSGLAVFPSHRGVASAATFSPPSLDFGATPAGTIAGPLTITFTNDTGDPIELTDAAITGANAADFQFALLDPNDCVVTAKGPPGFNELPAGEACDVQITFHPTAAGARSATLSISYTDGGGNPQVANAALTGVGTAHECDPDLNGTACGLPDVCGQIIHNITFEQVVVQRIKQGTACQSSDSVFITQTPTLEFEFGCDVVLIGSLFEWPEVIVVDGTLIANETHTTTEIQYLCEPVEAKIDIKFCSNPNGYNCAKNGVLPVTIFGSSQLDVSEIALGTVELCLASDMSSCVSAVNGGPPKDRGNPDTDLGTAQCSQDVANPDGLADLDVKFPSRAVASLIGCPNLKKGDASPALLIKGQLNDGTPFVSNAVGDIGIDQLLIQSKK